MDETAVEAQAGFTVFELGEVSLPKHPFKQINEIID